MSRLNLSKYMNKKKDKSLNPKEIIIPKEKEFKTTFVAQNAFEKMHRYRELYDNLTHRHYEFFAFLLKRPGEPFYRDVMLGKNQENTPSHTLVKAVDVKNCLDSLKGSDLVPSGWTHRHPRYFKPRSGEDQRNNLIVLSGMQANDIMKDYIITPMSHMEFDVVVGKNGFEIKGYDKREGFEYIFDAGDNLQKAKEMIPKLIEKRLPIKYSRIDSMIIRENVGPEDTLLKQL